MAASNVHPGTVTSDRVGGNPPPNPRPKTVRHQRSFMAPDMCLRGDVVKDRWEVLEKLGAGTFGQVYKVFDSKTGISWALKVESKDARKPALRMDVLITRTMDAKRHFAAFFACGHEPKFSYMISQLLGRNLAARKRFSQDGRFPLHTVIRIGIQAVQALRSLHESGFLHRDVKPSNLATGDGASERVIYLIDFGLARQYLDEKGMIYPPRPRTSFRGTVRYASPRAHVHQEMGRGDDLISLMYTLIDLHNGHLPWHNIRDMKRIGTFKVTIPSDELCRGFPPTWRQFYTYTRTLAYESIPDYDYLVRALNGVTEMRPEGMTDLRQLRTAEWEWDTPSGTGTAELASATTSG